MLSSPLFRVIVMMTAVLSLAVCLLAAVEVHAATDTPAPPPRMENLSVGPPAAWFSIFPLAPTIYVSVSSGSDVSGCGATSTATPCASIKYALSIIQSQSASTIASLCQPTVSIVSPLNNSASSAPCGGISVSSGTYIGISNMELDFSNANIALFAANGFGSVTIDQMGAGRFLVIDHHAGTQTANSPVAVSYITGFNFINGLGQ